MVMSSLWMYTMRRVATCAASSSIACVSTIRSGASYFPLSDKVFFFVPSAVYMPYSSVAATLPAAQSHRYFTVTAAPIITGGTATGAQPIFRSVTSTVPNSYIRHLLRYRSGGVIHFTYSGIYNCRRGYNTQQTLPRVGRHMQYIDSRHHTACSRRSTHSVTVCYNSESGVKFCSRSNESCSSTCCCTNSRSENFFKDGSSRNLHKDIRCSVQHERGFTPISDNYTDSAFHTDLHSHTQSIMSAVRKNQSLPTCFASISTYTLSLSGFSSYPSSLLPSLSRVLVSNRRLIATYRGVRTAAGAFCISSSAQPHISRAYSVKGDGTPGEKQNFSQTSASVKPKEAVLQEDEGACEPSKWEFAEVRRVPQINKRATVTADGEAAAGESEKARQLPEKVMSNVSVAGPESSTKPKTKRSPLSVTSRSRRVQEFGRRAPPLLRVTDAAVARIREIVETYNREAARPKTGTGATLRNGYREEEHDISESSHRSRIHVGNGDKVLEGTGKRSRAIGIRIGLKKRGCSGLSYTIDVATREEEKEDKQPSLTSSAGASTAAKTGGNRRFSAAAVADEMVETEGGTVVLAGDAIMFLVGTELDFIDTELERKFVFRNPNEKQACGCGKSFTV